MAGPSRIFGRGGRLALLLRLSVHPLRILGAGQRTAPPSVGDDESRDWVHAPLEVAALGNHWPKGRCPRAQHG